MSYFYPIRFRIRKIDFSYFYAKLVKVSVKANGLHEKKPLQPLWRCNGRASLPKLFFLMQIHRQKTCYCFL